MQILIFTVAVMLLTLQHTQAESLRTEIDKAATSLTYLVYSTEADCLARSRNNILGTATVSIGSCWQLPSLGSAIVKSCAGTKAYYSVTSYTKK